MKIKKENKFKILYTIGVFFFFLFSFQITNAAVLYSQTNTSVSGIAYGFMYATLTNSGVGLSSMKATLQWPSDPVIGTNQPHIEIYDNAGVQIGNQVPSTAELAEISANYATYHEYTFDLSTALFNPTYAFTNGQRYWFSLQSGSSNWVAQGSQNDNDHIAFQLADAGGFPPANTTTRIDTFTWNKVSTTTYIANVTGYINATTTPLITERLSFWKTSTLLGIQNYEEIIATTTGPFNVNFEFGPTITPGPTASTSITATTILHAEINRFDNNYEDPFGTYGLDTSLWKINLVSTTTSITASTTNSSEFDLTTTQDIGNYPVFDCGLNDLGGCIKNAIVWLFYPSQASTDQFKTLNTQLSQKAPFIYGYQAITLTTKLFSTTGSSTLTVSVPVHTISGTSTITFISPAMIAAVPFSGFIKSMLGWILWFMVIQLLYRQFLGIHNKDHTQTK